VLTTRVIPCLDVRGGRVVKGVRFSGLRDMGDPSELARAYQDQGADEIVLLDVAATLEERRAAIDTVERVRRTLSIALTVGGGVRTIDDAAALLAAGADKVSVNTAAVLQPALLSEMAERFGSQCTVIAVDAARLEEAPPPAPLPQAGGGRSGCSPFDRRRMRTGRERVASGGGTPSPRPPPASGRGERWIVKTRSGTADAPLDAVAWAGRAVELGAGEVLLTSWDRDGTRTGYDTSLLAAVADAVDAPVIASGGASLPGHMAEAALAGASAVLAASIFHEGEYTVDDVKRELRVRGVEVRL